MKPYTRDDAETDITDALTRGDQAAALAAAEAHDRMDEPPPVDLASAALWYAEQGIAVFPVQAGDKKPYPHTRGLHDATTSRDQVQAWWARMPDANIGLPTGHRFDVIDIDGFDGNVTLAQQVLDTPTTEQPYHGIPGVFGVVLTPRPGGRHLYVPVNPDSRNGAGAGGLDYRGRGGYVVAPPSVTEQGRYVWLRPLTGVAV